MTGVRNLISFYDESILHTKSVSERIAGDYIALVKNEISIVQSSLLGSILANLLLILGMAFLFGGLRFQEQIYNTTVTQMSACLLSLSVVSLLLPVSLSILSVISHPPSLIFVF